MKGKCKGATLPEVLIVIILSGILFLLLFEGMNILNKYNHILKNRLTMKNDLFYSHSTLELMMEETDSIRTAEEENVLLLYKAGEVRYTLTLDSGGFHVLYKEQNDTLFSDNLGWELHSPDNNRQAIDSLTVITLADNDTLNLEYSPSAILHLTSSNK